MKKFETRKMVEMSILVALAVVLDYLSNLFMGWFWPNGGSISISLVPIAILAFRQGAVAGFIGGFLMGTIQLMLGAYILHPIQVLFDYPLPYAVLGLAGVFRTLVLKSEGMKRMIYIWLATGIASIARLVCHVISGAVFFAPATGENPWIFSLLYNAPYVITSYVVSAFVLSLLYQKHTSWLTVKVSS